LNTPAATASRTITELEQHFRTKLFDRSARKLMLTDAGSFYVAALKRILPDISISYPLASRLACGADARRASLPPFLLL
jgi:DNA-binding transcriptional LysR family regulator